MTPIYILNGYCPLCFSDSSRHHLYASYFLSQGLPVTILTSGSRKEKLAHSHFCFIAASSLPYIHFIDTVARPRLLEWFEFSIRALLFLFPIVIHNKKTVIYSSHVHPLTLCVGSLLKKLFPAKVFFIIEIRDLWPHSLLFKYPRFQPSYLYSLIKLYFRRTIIISDLSIFLASGGPSYYSTEDQNHLILPNPICLDSIRNDNLPQDISFVYSGSMNSINGISLLVNAIYHFADNILNNQTASGLPDFTFHFIGSGTEDNLITDLVSYLSSNGISCHYWGFQDGSISLDIERRCRYSLVPILPQPVHLFGNSQNKVVSSALSCNHIIYTGIRDTKSLIDYYPYVTHSSPDYISLSKAISACLNESLIGSFSRISESSVSKFLSDFSHHGQCKKILNSFTS